MFSPATKKTAVRFTLAALVLGFCTSPGKAEDLPLGTAGELTKFTIPERNSDGILVWQLKGDRAKMRPDGKMEIERLSIDTYRNAAVDWTLSTPICLLNKTTREAVSESDVSIINKETEITGVGFHWLANETRFIIRNKAAVLIRNGLANKSFSSAPPEEKSAISSTIKPTSTIHSDTLTYDYNKRFATFEGNVVAVDPQLKLTCNTMDVLFDGGNNEVARVDAFGSVHMYHEDKEATGEKARFTRQSNIIVLSGNRPRLRDEKGNWIVSKGDGIVYNLLTKQMKVDKPTLEFQSSPKVAMSSDLVFAANPATSAAPSAANKPFTKIDSDLLDYDYEKRVASFEGNVIAIDPQLKLTCTRMVVYSDDKNEVSRVEAFGDVHMYNEGKEATGEKARFTRDNNTIVLSGKRPKLKDKAGNWLISDGDGIIYNVVTKKMHVDKPRMEVHSASDLTPPSPVSQ